MFELFLARRKKQRNNYFPFDECVHVCMKKTKSIELFFFLDHTLSKTRSEEIHDPMGSIRIVVKEYGLID